MAREPREELVRDLLRDQWDATNTYGLTPSIIFGWFDDKPDGQPAVTIRQGAEGPTDGGQTGYSSIDPSGGSPNQTTVGVVQCHIWTGRDDLDGASTSHQRLYNQRVSEEIRRIVKANADQPTNPDTGNQPVQSIAPGESTPEAEPDKRGVFHHRRDVNYWYQDTE